MKLIDWFYCQLMYEPDGHTEVKKTNLAYFLDDRYLSSEDSTFLDKVHEELEEFFTSGKQLDRVLLFPPVNNFHRLLIHRSIEDHPGLHSFSVGEGLGRRTVVCWKQSLISTGTENQGKTLPLYQPPMMRGRGRARQRNTNSPSTIQDPGGLSEDRSTDKLDNIPHIKQSFVPASSYSKEAYFRTFVKSTNNENSQSANESIIDKARERVKPDSSARERVKPDSSERWTHDKFKDHLSDIRDRSSPHFDSNRARQPDQQSDRLKHDMFETFIPNHDNFGDHLSDIRERSSPNLDSNRARQSDQSDRWKHDMFETTIPNLSHNFVPATNAKKEKTSDGLSYNLREDSSRCVEMSSPTSTPSNTGKPKQRERHRTKNKRPDMQVYVPRARRSQGSDMNNISPGDWAARSTNNTPSSASKSHRTTSQTFNKTHQQIEETHLDLSSSSNKVRNSDRMNKKQKVLDRRKSIEEDKDKDNHVDDESAVHDNSGGNLSSARIVKDTYSSNQTDNMVQLDSAQSNLVERDSNSLCYEVSEKGSRDITSQLSENVAASISDKNISEESCDENMNEQISYSTDSYKNTSEVHIEKNHALTKTCDENIQTNVVETPTCDTELKDLSNSNETEVVQMETSESITEVVQMETPESVTETKIETDTVVIAESYVETIGLPSTKMNNSDVEEDAILEPPGNIKDPFEESSVLLTETVNSYLTENVMIHENIAISSSDSSDTIHENNSNDLKSSLLDTDKENVIININTPSESKTDDVQEQSHDNMFDLSDVPSETESNFIKTNLIQEQPKDDEPEFTNQPCESINESTDFTENKIVVEAEFNANEIQADLEQDQTKEDEPSPANLQTDPTDEFIYNTDNKMAVDVEDNEIINKPAVVNPDVNKFVNKGEENADTEEDEEDTWDSMFNEDGDCLDPTAMEELTKTVGKVKIQKAKKINYLDYKPIDKGATDLSEYDHIIEIYDFPAEFVTRDLITAFQAFLNRGFDLKWVDDTHALGIFSSAIAAQDASSLSHPLIKVRPLSQASQQSRTKAKRCADFLRPYKPRPETSASAARRLVAGALGIATNVSKEKRERERQQLREAKEKRRKDRQNRDDIWEYGKCAMDEET